ncbi:hypothetical protein [Bdellovibrio sp. HCB209]|uniref:hypothetical protein n=1 Tax=Bdellovibrio sp. HCB209 TaxID=3394354 RepID=UPI0039B377C1
MGLFDGIEYYFKTFKSRGVKIHPDLIAKIYERCDHINNHVIPFERFNCDNNLLWNHLVQEIQLLPADRPIFINSMIGVHLNGGLTPTGNGGTRIIYKNEVAERVKSHEKLHYFFEEGIQHTQRQALLQYYSNRYRSLIVDWNDVLPYGKKNDYEEMIVRTLNGDWFMHLEGQDLSFDSPAYFSNETAKLHSIAEVDLRNYILTNF